MKRGGHSNLGYLIEEFRRSSDQQGLKLAEEIFSYGQEAVSHLERILQDVLEMNRAEDFSPDKLAWHVPAQTIFMLAHLHSEESLRLILEFLSQKDQALDYWLSDLLNDDIWEIICLLGANHLDALTDFVLRKNSHFLVRLAVCTALVQIALNDPSRQEKVTEIFTRLLNSQDDPEFLGLLINELIDLKERSLKPLMLRTLKENHIWPGIITAGEVKA
ncbi:MAG: DUF1186 domain-containing protein, partial [bacterium]